MLHWPTWAKICGTSVEDTDNMQHSGNVVDQACSSSYAYCTDLISTKLSCITPHYLNITLLSLLHQYLRGELEKSL